MDHFLYKYILNVIFLDEAFPARNAKSSAIVENGRLLIRNREFERMKC